MTPSTKLILDTTVLSNFACSESIEKLCELPETNLVVTRCVILEVSSGVDEGYEFLQNALEVLPDPRRTNTGKSNKIAKNVGISKWDRSALDPELVLSKIETDWKMSYYHLLNDVSGEKSRTKIYDIRDTDEEEAERFAKDCINELDIGEASVLVEGYIQDATIATDDLDARDVAKNHGINVTGSLGILAKCVKEGVVDTETANEWLQVWVEQNEYYSPVDDIRDLL